MFNTGVSITHFAGRTLPLKYSNFQQIYKKLSQFYKKLNFEKNGAKSRKQCSIRMLVGLHVCAYTLTDAFSQQIYTVFL